MEYSRLEIAEEVVKQIPLGEPIVIFSMPGMGKHYERRLLAQLIENSSNLKNIQVIGKDLFTVDEMFELLKEVEGMQGKVLLILGQCLNYGQDASWFIEQLNAIKDKKHNLDLNTIIFTSPSSVSNAVKNKVRLVSRITNYKKPLAKDFAVELIKKYEQKYEFSLNEKNLDEIYDLTSGHIGMMKNLVMELKLNPEIKLSIENLIHSESIKGWLFELTEDLSKEMLEVLVGIREDQEVQQILKKCGYCNEKDEIFSPLLKAYLDRNLEKKFNSSNFENNLSDQEIKSYQLLKNSNNKIVSREDIAKAIWSDEWLDKYSDWAIDQLMHSLRDKMKNHNADGKILTVRGKGYRFEK